MGASHYIVLLINRVGFKGVMELFNRGIGGYLQPRLTCAPCEASATLLLSYLEGPYLARVQLSRTTMPLWSTSDRVGRIVGASLEAPPQREHHHQARRLAGGRMSTGT
jgi:hypothetical protein